MQIIRKKPKFFGFKDTKSKQYDLKNITDFIFYMYRKDQTLLSSLSIEETSIGSCTPM